ncbi:MAG: hypothetical protein WC899_11615 [bacterium]|jgi:hypothetical protein
MRKGFLTVMAVVLVAAMAAPAMAEFSTSGFLRVKARVDQNMQVPSAAGTQGGTFILPGADPRTAAFVEQRQRFSLNWKGENAGAVGLFEMDFGAWGDSAYTAGRNQGAGLEADSINLETKDFYLWFNIPNTSVKVTAGLQNVTDSFQGVVLGAADMAGIFVTGKGGPVDYRLGWAKFQEGNTRVDDDVDFYIAEAKFAPTKAAKLGVDFYVLRDASGSTAAGSGTFGTNLNTIGRIFTDYGIGATSFRYDPSTFYYLGVDGAFQAGPVGLSGFAFYNFGKVKGATGTIGGDNTISNEDFDVKAYVVDVRADIAAGPGKAFVEGAYVSGSDRNSSDFESPITGSNYALAGSYPFARMDMQILLPNADELNTSSALAYDAQNKGRGLILLVGGFSMKFNDALSGKVGAGYMQDTESPDSSVNKHKAVEVNANVNYTVAKGMDIGLYGAYAFLSDWEDYGTGNGTVGSTVYTASATKDADNIFKTYLRMNYAF